MYGANSDVTYSENIKVNVYHQSLLVSNNSNESSLISDWGEWIQRILFLLFGLIIAGLIFQCCKYRKLRQKAKKELESQDFTNIEKECVEISNNLQYQAQERNAAADSEAKNSGQTGDQLANGGSSTSQI